MDVAKKQQFIIQGHEYFQRGATIPHDKHEGPVVVDAPVWMGRLAAWVDRFIRISI
jgi:hypothetical protein